MSFSCCVTLYNQIFYLQMVYIVCFGCAQLNIKQLTYLISCTIPSTLGGFYSEVLTFHISSNHLYNILRFNALHFHISYAHIKLIYGDSTEYDDRELFSSQECSREDRFIYCITCARASNYTCHC